MKILRLNKLITIMILVLYLVLYSGCQKQKDTPIDCVDCEKVTGVYFTSQGYVEEWIYTEACTEEKVNKLISENWECPDYIQNNEGATLSDKLYLDSPANEEVNVNFDVSLAWQRLSYTNGNKVNGVSYDVYLGTDPTPPLAFQTLYGFNWKPMLAPSTLYYWKVVANSNGEIRESDIWSFSTNSNTGISYGTFTDPRDGHIYNTVTIYDQTWMAENINYGERINGNESQENNLLSEKYCYGDNESNCNTYGGLYQWHEMMQYDSTEGTQGICPDGWHIPSKIEWFATIEFLGGYWFAGGKLKETGTTHWSSPNTGATNASGFTALPGGYYYDGNFEEVNVRSYFWTSTKYYGGSAADGLRLDYSSIDVYGWFYHRNMGFSVRCIKDN